MVPLSAQIITFKDWTAMWCVYIPVWAPTTQLHVLWFLSISRIQSNCIYHDFSLTGCRTRRAWCEYLPHCTVFRIFYLVGAFSVHIGSGELDTAHWYCCHDYSRETGHKYRDVYAGIRVSLNKNIQLQKTHLQPPGVTHNRLQLLLSDISIFIYNVQNTHFIQCSSKV